MEESNAYLRRDPTCSPDLTCFLSLGVLLFKRTPGIKLVTLIPHIPSYPSPALYRLRTYIVPFYIVPYSLVPHVASLRRVPCIRFTLSVQPLTPIPLYLYPYTPITRTLNLTCPMSGIRLSSSFPVLFWRHFHTAPYPGG